MLTFLCDVSKKLKNAEKSVQPPPDLPPTPSGLSTLDLELWLHFKEHLLSYLEKHLLRVLADGTLNKGSALSEKRCAQLLENLDKNKLDRVINNYLADLQRREKREVGLKEGDLAIEKKLIGDLIVNKRQMGKLFIEDIGSGNCLRESNELK